MKDQNSSLTDLQLRRNYNRIQNQHSPAAINLCRQLAWSFQVRLPVLLSTPDWENRLLQEARSAIKQQRGNFKDMSIEDAVMLMFMLISEDARQDMKDMLQEMNEAREQKQRIRALLVRLVDEAEGRRPKWPPR